MAGRSFRQSIIPSYYIEDCRILHVWHQNKHGGLKEVMISKVSVASRETGPMDRGFIHKLNQQLRKMKSHHLTTISTEPKILG